MTKPNKPPTVLRGFHVNRSGGRMTAYGENIETGKQDKITGIDRIDPPSNNALHEVVATDQHGTKHRLVFP